MATTTITGLQATAQRLQGVVNRLNKEIKPFLEHAAVPVVQEVQARAPVGMRIHTRYPYKGRGKRAGKGKGQPVATYHPGNLKRSISNLKLRRSQAVFVGPKFGSSKGIFKGKRVDAYYAHMVEYGTKHSAARPFIRPGALAARPEVIRRMKASVRFLVKKYGLRT